MAEDWEPPTKVEELFRKAEGNLFTTWNRPTSGARSDAPVQVGSAPIQLYSLATPNGQKLGILLEELGVEYDAWVTDLSKLQQFDQGFVEVNPNSKIPCAVDHAPVDGGAPVRLFESGAIMIYLAEKYGQFLPRDPRGRAECFAWLMWQMAGQGPMTGNFGHFMVYAPGNQHQARDYGVARYGMETQRLCHVLDTHLKDRTYICGDQYTIADMACLPWFATIRSGKAYRHQNGVAASSFLSLDQYKNLNRWCDLLEARPQVQRGMLVCRKYGKPWLKSKRWAHLASKL
mmetsp:Transcript_18958/g.21235  ORF Transcript_18958/g.21235 Transcript_18958/m.21235 type:complete len:288 (+) Transcript_18958:18-881(+)|eukprot:CAMPEP_0205832730 /NCGR_PEP_ID=MMETSP0206-20130828/47773_1 /ASSEMBLY_ACC=CAM_ASM_000279 /TAXON_ID=36767 /ORGANISM="Euplotes focardii, Strain TN1" /LENGTH=287 /DNA_ID=CAMNT_0053138533 /DNA_START=16 /DNA_END=879 /DNA_ORIENTATION=+